MNVHYSQLIKGKDYYIQAPYTYSDRKYIGEFLDLLDAEYFGKQYCRFVNVRPISPKSCAERITFYGSDTYYDVEEIRKNKQRAIQTMENRTLNMILKRLVNEEFEWS